MKTGLYIHYPFCLSKCPYCDFNSVVADKTNPNDILNAFIRDLQYYHSLIGSRKIDTIYFGGGTPSLMSPQMIKNILNEIHKLFKVKTDAEITLEANPLTAEIQKFKEFKTAGINRLSIGVQSLSEKGLKTLGRTHDTKQAKNAIIMAKEIFNRSSFDLIYGWQGQTIKEWETELTEALKYENGHLSIYQLTIYKGTLLAKSGAIEISPEQSLLFDKKTKEILATHNIKQYEISNYAKAGEESQHNQIYWNYDDYIGIGAGASGRLTIKEEKLSFLNEKNINKWLKSCSPKQDILSDSDKAEEYMLMGLRLNNGINIKRFKEKTNIDISNILNDKEYLKEFIKIENGYLIATEKGLNCLNSLILKLL